MRCPGRHDKVTILAGGFTGITGTITSRTRKSVRVLTDDTPPGWPTGPHNLWYDLTEVDSTPTSETTDRDQWIRAFNALDAAINHHHRDTLAIWAPRTTPTNVSGPPATSSSAA